MPLHFMKTKQCLLCINISQAVGETKVPNSSRGTGQMLMHKNNIFDFTIIANISYYTCAYL